MNLGAYHFPRHGRGSAPYPWVEADVGDAFVVVADDVQRAMRSLRACRREIARRLEWRPAFALRRAGERTIVVERTK